MRYFAYGSNMSAAQMAERCPGASLDTVASVRDHRLDFTRHSPRWAGGVADLRPQPRSQVWGLLWSVTDHHLDELDRREGHPRHYRRREIDVVTPAGLVTAWTYEVAAKEAFIMPTPTYLGILIAAAEEHRFPPDYLAFLRSIDQRGR
jgi:gamma-glutamylcyclotransferase (GGCT)/AIG2-like uncharacterized protein YtfP